MQILVHTLCDSSPVHRDGRVRETISFASHGIGLEIHKRTDPVCGNKTRLDPVIHSSNESMIAAGEPGVRPGECMDITGDGVRTLSKAPPSVNPLDTQEES